MLVNEKPVSSNNLDVNENSISKRSWCILLGGLFLSLIIKFYFIKSMGNFDMEAYHDWGNKVLDAGLANAYHGVYFPFQWNLLSLCSWLSNEYEVPWIISFKLANLLFDIAMFLLLILLLKRYKLNPLYALLYCLQPWFLIIFIQGFIDSQFTFFLLLPLLLLRDENNNFKSYFISGIPLACAFLMKPQVMMIVLAIFIYIAWSFYKRKKWTPIAILIPAVLLFLGYALYFAAFRHELYIRSLDITIPGAFYLPISYLSVGSIMPCLTASMDNVWYPVAYFMKQVDASIYSVNIPLITILTVILTLSSIIIFIIYLGKKYEYTLNSKCLFYIITFVSFIVPFVMTSAHCNHPFPATVLLIVLSAMLYKNKAFKFIFNAFLLLMFLAVFSRYGWGGGHESSFISHNGIVSNSIAILATVCFIIILRFLIKTAFSGKDGKHSINKEA